MVMFSTTSSRFSFLYRDEHLGFSKLKTKKNERQKLMLGGRGGGYSDCLFGRNVEDKKKISLQLKKTQPLTLIFSFESCTSLHRATQIQMWKSRCFIFVFVHFRPLFQDKCRLEWLLWRRLLAFLVAWNMFVWAAHVRTFEWNKYVCMGNGPALLSDRALGHWDLPLSRSYLLSPLSLFDWRLWGSIQLQSTDSAWSLYLAKSLAEMAEDSQ